MSLCACRGRPWRKSRYADVEVVGRREGAGEPDECRDEDPARGQGVVVLGIEGFAFLVQRNDASDPESGGAYTIKKFTRKGKKVVLKAKDPKYDIFLKDDAEYSQKYRAIAEFKRVL